MKSPIAARIRYFPPAPRRIVYFRALPVPPADRFADDLFPAADGVAPTAALLLRLDFLDVVPRRPDVGSASAALVPARADREYLLPVRAPDRFSAAVLRRRSAGGGYTPGDTMVVPSRRVFSSWNLRPVAGSGSGSGTGLSQYSTVQPAWSQA